MFRDFVSVLFCFNVLLFGTTISYDKGFGSSANLFLLRPFPLPPD